MQAFCGYIGLNRHFLCLAAKNGYLTVPHSYSAISLRLSQVRHSIAPAPCVTETSKLIGIFTLTR